MTRITTSTFYAEARDRLTTITSDEALLTAFDLQAEYDLAGDSESDDPRLVERWDTAMGDFLAEIMRFRMSLDYLFGGKGAPFLPPLPDIDVCEVSLDFLRLPPEIQKAFATFTAALADYERRLKISRLKP